MEKQLLRGFCQRGEQPGEAGSPLKFIASTEGVKRDGKDLQADHWRLDNYRKNPVFLWCHDLYGRTLPIGKSVVAVEGAQLIAEVTFDQGDDFAKQVERKYREGYLHAVSVGWDDVKEGTEVWYELFDISGVPVPGDPDALIERQLRALKELIEKHDPEEGGAIPPHSTNKETEEADWDAAAEVSAANGKSQLRRMHAWVDDEGDADVTQSYRLPHHQASGEVVWKGVAAAMSRLFQSATQIPEADRQGVYTHLARHYRQFDKEAPELRTAEELAALSPELIRGLFLHDEFEAHEWRELFNAKELLERAGAVLNARNCSDLVQAVTLIQGVLERAQKEEPPEDSGNEDERSEEEDLARLLILKLRL